MIEQRVAKNQPNSKSVSDVLVYNRSSRVWQVAGDGRVAEFPAGPEGKRAATQMAIWVLNPQLHALAQSLASRHPQLESRAWKAAAYIADGRIAMQPGNGPILALVQGSSPYGPYTIQRHDDETTCDCLDYTGFTAPMLATGARLCAHIIATQMMLRLAPATPADPAETYADGTAVSADLLSSYKAYCDQYHRAPRNRAALVSWIYR